MKRLTYSSSGVDIQKAQRFKQQIAGLRQKSAGTYVLKDLGSFGGMFCFPKEKYKEPVLVASCDGVGTKLKIAQLLNKHDTVGIDLVAMNVNDILCFGAQPLFFLDYIACGRLEQKTLLAIVKGINKGCLESDSSLIGGETAEMPGMYKQGEYDLAGFCVGVVEKKNIIDGSRIKVGDVVIGLESNGLHSNGFSLVRKILSHNDLRLLSKELLKPTRIYVKPILALCAMRYALCTIKGIAHITGGSFYNKVSKILPGSAGAIIYKRTWPVPKIFSLIQEKGNIAEQEMYRTFNMGVGMVLVVTPKFAKPITRKLAADKLPSWIIGKIVSGKQEVKII